MVIPFTSFFFLTLSLLTFKFNAEDVNVAVKDATAPKTWFKILELIYSRAKGSVSDDSFQTLTNFFVKTANADDNLSKCKAAGAYYVLLDYLATNVEQAYEQDPEVKLDAYVKNAKLFENSQEFLLQYTSCHRTPSYDNMLKFLLYEKHFEALTSYPQALILHAKYYPNYLTSYFDEHQCSCFFQEKKLTCFPKVKTQDPLSLTDSSNTYTVPPPTKASISSSTSLTPITSVPSSSSFTSGGGYGRNTNTKSTSPVKEDDQEDESCWTDDPEPPQSSAYTSTPEMGAYAHLPGMGAYANQPGMGAYANPSSSMGLPVPNANANPHAEAPSSPLEITSVDTEALEESHATKTFLSMSILSFVVCFLFSL